MVNNLSGGKLNGSLAIGKIGGTVDCKKNVYVGEVPQEYTEVWFDPSEEGIIDEVATKKFVEERTVKLETSLEHLESEVNELKEGNINIDLTNYATKTELSKKLDKSELNGAINTALESAKNSGEFKGQDGYTPIKGIDYFTETDKGELLERILQSLPTWKGGSY